MKNNADQSARTPTIGVLLLVPILLLAIACSTQGLAQSPDPTTAPEVTEAPATDPPADDTPQADDATPPADDATSPADGATSPADDATSLADGGQESESDSDIPIWVWLLIAGAVGLLIVALTVLSQRGGSVAIASQSQWHNAALDAYASSAALHDIVSANLSADAMGGAAEDWERRWEGTERRINDLATELHALDARTGDPDAAALVRRLITDLSALRSAVDASLYLRSREDAAELTEEQIAQSESLTKERLSQFYGSLHAFKAHVDENA